MAFLGPWPTHRRVAVAVSGGADSLCLAWLARSWGDPFAFIVDHGLRLDSAAEARQAAATLAKFGVASRVLTLGGLASGPGLAARARSARYAVLTEAAREAGFSDLLLGHHAGDQAETVLLREAGGSGPAGLAAMAVVSETPSLRVVRPLLAVSAALLRAVLREQGIAWADDPSNSNPAAARTRVRQKLARTQGESAQVRRAENFGSARRAAEMRIAEVLATRASIFPEGYAVLTPGALEPAALAALIRALTGAAYPARSAALARLAGGRMIGTLGGIRFMPAGGHGSGTLAVREVAALPPPVPAMRGAIWDKRFRLETDEIVPKYVWIGALGDDVRKFSRQSKLGFAILCTLPALRDENGLVAVPHLGYFRGGTNPRLRLTFCPSDPVAGAPFQPYTLGDAQTARAHHVLDEAGTAHPGVPDGPAGIF